VLTARLFLSSFALCGVVACGTVPSYDALIEKHVSSTDHPKIAGAHGPLSTRQTKAILARLRASDPNADILQRHLVIEQNVSGTPIVAGNRTRLLRDGRETFKAIFTAIRGARHHINLEYYIFEDVEVDGEHIVDLLIAKRASGVAVNIIYDSYGSGQTPAEVFTRLADAGVILMEFRPLNPLKSISDYSINDRDHRKIMVVDGKIGIVGGVNLSKTYQSRIPGAKPPPGDAPETWRDTDLEIRGPAVSQLQDLFLQHWEQQNGPTMDKALYYPAQQAIGYELVRIIGSSPDDPIPRYYVTLLSAMRSAEESIWISAAYFVPTPDEKDELMEAAGRGIDVRLLLPAHSDSQLVLSVGQSHYSALLKAGIKIYEHQDDILHSKTAVIDGVWSVVGSSNLDPRSILFNDEVDAVVLGTSTGRALQEMFKDDQASAKQLDLESWSQRPLLRKLNELYSRIWESLL
tara:strand:- start:5167 stop:6552 length:1386 start_codon:yes stop_codon:yes gene_type:complete